MVLLIAPEELNPPGALSVYYVYGLVPSMSSVNDAFKNDGWTCKRYLKDKLITVSSKL